MEPVVSVAQGQLRGRAEHGVLSFKAIPYAGAPFGASRFAAPVPADSWEGVRDATEFGPTVPKPPYPSPIDQLFPEPVIAGEQCLNLNVWTPGVEGARPVFVWIHGGAFVHGSGAVSAYDGAKFARDGIVCVTINYRLGVDGFLLIEGAPANRGLLDQVAALRWVRENIAAFGGDPDAVTIAGESAGAMSVMTLLSMPATAGLFRRAIAQSGAGHHVIVAATAAKLAAALARDLGVEPTVEGFAAVPIDDLVAGQADRPVGRRWSRRRRGADRQQHRRVGAVPRPQRHRRLHRRRPAGQGAHSHRRGRPRGRCHLPRRTARRLTRRTTDRRVGRLVLPAAGDTGGGGPAGPWRRHLRLRIRLALPTIRRSARRLPRPGDSLRLRQPGRPGRSAAGRVGAAAGAGRGDARCVGGICHDRQSRLARLRQSADGADAV